jgi:hypothetical protein
MTEAAAEEGSRVAREGSYEKALESYRKALGSLSDEHGEGPDILRVKLHLNSSFCHLKLRNFEVRSACDERACVDPFC